jgi:hypothetical protein
MKQRECYMPLYNFVNTETGERFSESLKLSEREEFLKNNPDLKQAVTAPNMIRANSTTNKDGGWNENMSRIAAAHPHSPLAAKVGGRASKDVKNEAIRTKHKLGSSFKTS